MIVESIPRGRIPDRSSIAPRSRFDRTAIVVFFHESPTPSDWNPMLQKSSRRERKIGLHVTVRSRSRGLDVDGDKLSSCRHVAIGEPSDRRHLNPSFAHVMNLMIAWTRVHAISAVPTAFDACSVSTSPAQVRTVWDIVPHGENSRFCCA